MVLDTLNANRDRITPANKPAVTLLASYSTSPGLAVIPSHPFRENLPNKSVTACHIRHGWNRDSLSANQSRQTQGRGRQVRPASHTTARSIPDLRLPDSVVVGGIAHRANRKTMTNRALGRYGRQRSPKPQSTHLQPHSTSPWGRPLEVLSSRQ
jgi:hypothetical protein